MALDLELLESSQEFLVANESLVQKWLKNTRELFLEAKKLEPVDSIPSELFVEGFDLEGIWSQIELLNQPNIEYIQEQVANAIEELETREDESGINSQSESPVMDVELGSDLQDFDEGEEQDYEEEVDFDEEEEQDFEQETKDSKRKRSEVDDDFFSLEEMNRFADMGEARDLKMTKVSENEQEDDEDDEQVIFSIGKDLDQDLEEEEDDDNANEIMYEDFFGKKRPADQPARKSWLSEMDVDQPMEEKQETRQMEKDPEEAKDLFDDEEENEKTKTLSTYEKQQLKLKEQIKALEQENIAEKKWALKGEASSKVRPVNSLLEEDLDFETSAKPVPVITEETTATLEDMIIQRIKDEAWDDVVRKAPPKDTIYDPNRQFELLDQKNPKSLAQVYEEEYQKQTSKENIVSEKSIELEKKHEEINQLFDSLSKQLDALSNYHYVPNEATLELTVLPSATAPAISMEEITPANVSDALLAAPKEVYAGNVGKSQEEMDANDRKKARVKAKKIARRNKKEREQAKALLQKESGVEEQTTKQSAIKKLMTQSNVTIISDKKNKADLSKGKATVIEKGSKAGKEKPNVRPEMLRL